MKTATLVKSVLLLLGHAAALSAATTWNSTFVVSTAIPDDSLVGVANTHTVTSNITAITEVNLAITLTGGWNGDLYAYLAHDDGFCILLNRPGRSLVLPDGSGTANLDVLFTDAASLDLHTAIPASGPVSGSYQPDARNVDPASALDTSPRSAYLGTFGGLDPNGDWTLFVADLSPGGSAVLQSWTLTVTGVPEPTSCMLLVVSGLFLLKRRR